MDLFKTLQLIVVLFLATCLFCWVFTSDWIFNPIVTVISFFGGLLLISFIGIIILKQE